MIWGDDESTGRDGSPSIAGMNKAMQARWVVFAFAVPISLYVSFLGRAWPCASPDRLPAEPA
jgi:hypothetical protein